MAIGGERDEAIIFDFMTLTSVIIKGHTSFVNGSIFLDLQELE